MATGAIGLVAEALRPQLGWGYADYGLVLFASLVSVAVALWQLGADMALGKATTCAEGEHQLAPA